VRRAGMTVLEVTIALTIVSTVLLASAGAFLSSIVAVNAAQRTSRATVFLETVMENLSAQAYDDLIAFNGNRVYDQATSADSNYEADLSVFVSAVDLLQVQVVLLDVRTNQEIGRLTTLRSRR
jgi:type II secretory pathway pseudopilin PulG